MSGYASGTSVSVDRSKGEIEGILARYGATEFMYGTSALGAVVAFRAKGRVIRFLVPLPGKTDKRFTVSAAGRLRKPAALEDALAQEGRRRWRALGLCIKAKLESVASGIATFETEFMPYTVLSNGRTVHDCLGPEIDRALAGGVMPRMLELLPAPKEEA